MIKNGAVLLLLMTNAFKVTSSSVGVDTLNGTTSSYQLIHTAIRAKLPKGHIWLI